MINIESASEELQKQLRAIIDRCRLTEEEGQRDWTVSVATAIVYSILYKPPNHFSDTALSDDNLYERNKIELNNLLERLSYEADNAAEYARNVLTPARAHLDVRKVTHTEISKLFRFKIAELRDDNEQLETSFNNSKDIQTIFRDYEIAIFICLSILHAHSARDDYNYETISQLVSAVDTRLDNKPGEAKHFDTFAGLTLLQQLGLARESLNPKFLIDLQKLRERIRGRVENNVIDIYKAHALSQIYNSITHVSRDALLAFESASRSNSKSVIEWMDKAGNLLADLGTTIGEDDQSETDYYGNDNTEKADDLDDVGNSIKHQLFYCLHYSERIQADIALLRAQNESMGETSDDERAMEEHYDRAAGHLEQAIARVPSENVLRKSYYVVVSENLELERVLRRNLFFNTRASIDERLKGATETIKSEAKEELEKTFREVSLRIVEILGIFIAIVGIVGTSVISATVGDLEFWKRLTILLVGGLIPVVYFYLLRMIVHSSRVPGNLGRSNETQ